MLGGLVIVWRMRAAHCGEGFMKLREDSVFPDRGGNAMPVHVGPQ
jgi:hypothetical protein